MFSHKKENQIIQKFLRAEEIRKTRKYHRYKIEKSEISLRDSLERTGDYIQRLEKSLQEISLLREQRRNLKERQLESTRQIRSLYLKEKIKLQVLEQKNKSKYCVQKNLTDILIPQPAHQSRLPLIPSPSITRSLSTEKKQSSFLSSQVLRKNFKMDYN